MQRVHSDKELQNAPASETEAQLVGVELGFRAEEASRLELLRVLEDGGVMRELPGEKMSIH